jgi:hypothetical protein
MVQRVERGAAVASGLLTGVSRLNIFSGLGGKWQPQAVTFPRRLKGLVAERGSRT